MNKKLKPWFELEERERAGDEILAFRSVYYAIPNGGGLPFESNVIDMAIGKDGHISLFSDDAESHVYLYPEQVRHLKKAITAARKVKED